MSGTSPKPPSQGLIAVEMRPWVRRLLYVAIYEGLAVCLAAAGLMILSGQGMQAAAPVAVATSIVAVIWNFVFNAGFEAWERRQTVKGRSLARRLLHAIGFEVGLIAFLTPLIAVMLGVTLLEAFFYDLSLIVLFLVYTFLFNLGFDLVFGLPESARA